MRSIWKHRLFWPSAALLVLIAYDAIARWATTLRH